MLEPADTAALDHELARPPGGDVAPDDLIVVTGAAGFIGTRVVRTLLRYGQRRIRCLARPTARVAALEQMGAASGASLDIVRGNLLSREDCRAAAGGAAVVYHLAAGTDKTFPGCFLNSVVATRNLLDSLGSEPSLRRFVNVGSLAIYSNEDLGRAGVLDETCAVDDRIADRHDPYAYAKAKQDELVREYGRTRGIPYVIVRPGVTFGPGKTAIPGRVGNRTFGVFLHLGLGRTMPLTYVDNCADAIVLAGLTPGHDGEVVNVIDDELPTSSAFLRAYKQKVRRFVSIPMPYPAFYAFSWLWERYSTWSEGQLPPVFNRRACRAYYRGSRYSNRKAKALLGWRPRVTMTEAIERYCAYAREAERER